ncbi:MAG: hypothetical protein ABL967_18400 [Bryobacteraceae bacterium]
MHTIYTNANVNDNLRRSRLYAGQLYVYAPTEGSKKLGALARRMIEEAFYPRDPRTAQFFMPVEEYVSIVAPLKPKFIHHPETRGILREIAAEMACDLDQTYLDVPRLRMVTHGGYLTAGVGFAHPAHRDTWYSAPLCQINWWLPIYDLESDQSMAFHPQYWDRTVKNDSDQFNYYRWNSDGRANAAAHIKTDTRKQPRPQQPLELQPEVRVVTEPDGMLLFSAAQLHSTVPNTAGFTRYSIDFRTVNLRDLEEDAGAPNLDSRCTGTSLRDFVRASDFAPMPEELALRYGGETKTPDDVLVFRPNQEGARV